MGCDIHCYIEYRSPNQDRWNGFGGRINPGRNYWMFGAIAGVRAGHIPHLEPRGIPENLGYEASDDYWLFIVENPRDGEGYASPEQAERWMKYGSVLQNPEKPLIHNRVSNPDWHSHTWLTTDEYELAIAAYLEASGFQINTPRLPAPSEVSSLATTQDPDAAYALSSLAEYWAILASLRCFEAQGKEARLVCWFDN